MPIKRENQEKTMKMDNQSEPYTEFNSSLNTHA